MVGLLVFHSHEHLNSTKHKHRALCRAEEQYVSPSTERKIKLTRYQIQDWRQKEEMCILILIFQSSSSCLHPKGGEELPVSSSTVCFLLYLIYLFGQAGSWLRHVGFSLSCRVFRFRVLSSCNTRGSVGALLRPSCPTACRILVPWPGIGPTSLELQRGFLTTGLPAKSPPLYFYCYFSTQHKVGICSALPPKASLIILLITHETQPISDA